jgi:pyruvate,orthophosphate dikinase
MQARAVMEAACELAKEGKKIVPEIMIPLVGMVSEMKAPKELIREVVDEILKQNGVRLSYLVGTMIELPRAAVTAGRIAEQAEFFSFGTNDLTQTTFGFSRDDAAKFVAFYMRRQDTCPKCQSAHVNWKEMVCQSCGAHIGEKAENILDGDPFAVLDREGVGAMMRMAIAEGRATRPDIKLGICGEHGGDPSSVEFCHELGLDYVSCSPFRVPIARLAAAQAALQEAAGKPGSKPRKGGVARKKPTHSSKRAPAHKTSARAGRTPEKRKKARSRSR